MDISAVVLNKIIQEKNLEAWARLKLLFLDPAYSSLYVVLSKHYEKYNEIPSFEELDLTIRDVGQTKKTLAAIKLVDVPEVSLDVALDALLDQYTQNETIKLLSRYIDNIPILSSVELKEDLANIVLTLDEKTLTTEGVYNMSTMLLFETAEEISASRVPLGINNTFDAALAGIALQELVLIGGKRGAGKSVISANIACNQYEIGNTVPYFSIEMTAKETLQRFCSILSGVDNQQLKQGKLPYEELLKVVKVRANMFQESEDLVEEYMRNRDPFKFEEQLVRTKKLKEDNQLIIIDDRSLSITSIDLHLGKLKAKFGSKFKIAVVDYINQIVLEGNHSQYDWQPQIEISKKLKNLARKYDIIMVSPYQIDGTGEARFGKGILDAADIAIILEAHDKETNAISFDTTKMRGASEMGFTSGIDWRSLRMCPISITRPKIKEVEKKSKADKKDDSSADIFRD